MKPDTAAGEKNHIHNTHASTVRLWFILNENQILEI